MLRTAVPAAVAAAGVDPARVIGIATDFTACTVLPTTTEGLPLALLPEWSDRPHAWPKLWKHHAAQEQADRINALAHERGEKWISRYGGRISSEWQFAKALQVLEEDPEVYAACARWIEAADWIVWQLTGAESRNTCTAGYKGIHQDGAYPSPGYLGRLHPDFADFPATRLEHPLSALGSRVGGLSGRAAAWTGLPEGIAVAAGNVDAHVAAPAAGAVENGRLLAIMGTSTCHVLNGATLADVPGICGVVEGGIVEGAYGYEAGQSAVGDIFAWWLRQGVPDDYRTEARDSRRGSAPAPDPQGHRPPGRGARTGRPGLDERQPLHPRRPPPLRRHRGAHPRHPPRGRLPGPARIHRVRHPGHRRGVRGRMGFPWRSSSSPAG